MEKECVCDLTEGLERIIRQPQTGFMAKYEGLPRALVQPQLALALLRIAILVRSGRGRFVAKYSFAR